LSVSINESKLSRPLLIVLFIVFGLSLLTRLIPEPRTIDDAFITFRYSRNLVDGHGFVYNPGSRTLGTTTPLFTLVMAGISFVTGSENYPWFALIVNALVDGVTAVLLALLIYQITNRVSAAAVIGVLWAVSPMSVTFAIGGMETSVAILWNVAATYAYFTRRKRLVGLFAGLGIITRIDSLIWVGPLLLAQAITWWFASRSRPLRQRVPWQSWALFGVSVVPWHLFSWAYFGTLLSRSMEAKRVAYIVGDYHALTRLLQHIATPFFEHELLGVPGIVIGIVLYPGLAGIGTFYVGKRHPRLLPFLLYPWVYLIVFSAANPLIFRWYLAPILPAYFLAILIGIWALADSITTAAKRPHWLPAAIGVIGLVMAGLSLNAWVLKPDHGPQRPAPDMAWHEIELYYQEMGETLRDEYDVTENTLVAAGDIGAVGYYSRARILDTVGLVTPELTAYYPLDTNLVEEDQNYAVPPAIVFDYRPDYIVFMEMFVRHGLALDPEFEALYKIVKFIPTDFYGTGMILYQRRDLADE
jgi:hypothetical protein